MSCYDCEAEEGHRLNCRFRLAKYSAVEKKVYEIIRDLSDRRGLGQEWDAIDDETKEEIFATWVKIVEAV